MYCDILAQAKVLIIRSKLEPNANQGTMKIWKKTLIWSVLNDIFVKEIVFDLSTTEVNDMLQAFEWNREYLLFCLKIWRYKIGSVLNDIFVKEILFDLSTTEVNDILLALEYEIENICSSFWPNKIKIFLFGWL